MSAWGGRKGSGPGSGRVRPRSLRPVGKPPGAGQATGFLPSPRRATTAHASWRLTHTAKVHGV